MKAKDSPLKYKLHKTEKKAVLMMILPALAESLLSHTFALVDSAMLGNAPDAAISIASVGLTTSLLGLITNIMNAFCIGTTAAVAWFLGSRNSKDAQSTARQTLTVTGIFGLILTLVCTFGAETIVNFMGDVDERVFQGAVDYFAIISVGYVFQFMTTNISATLRGAKITKYTMYYNLIANAANVGMNYILIFGKLGFEPMGLQGAAIATTASKIVAFILAFGVITLKKSPIRLSLRKSFLPRKRIMSRVLRIGLATSMEQVLLQGGNVLFTKIIAGIPTVEFSAYNVAGNISGFVWNVSGACAVASTTYMGIHMGEGREDKCRGFTAYIIRISLSWMSLLTAGLILLSGVLPNLFVNDPQVAAVATQLLPIAAIYGLPVAIHQPLAGALRSAGDTLSPLIASFCSLWIFRVALGWILIHWFDLGIFFALIAVALDQSVRAAINLTLYHRGRWCRRLRSRNGTMPQPAKQDNR